MDVTVAIPWRAEPQRLAPYDRVRRFWDYAGLPVVLGDSDPGKPFNRAQARNNAVRQVTTGTVILCDADTIPDLAGVLAAAAKPGDGLISPFAVHRQIPADWVDKTDLLAAPAVEESDHHVSGCWVLRTDTYWKIGGCDEAFTQWGGEDVAFWYAAEALVGVRRDKGFCHAFWQETERSWEQANPLLKKYEAARGRAWLMREVLRNR